MQNIKRVVQADNKTGSAIICEEILKNRDYQLGHTKVFLKDEQQLFLEQERDRALTKKILIIQKHIKGNKNTFDKSKFEVHYCTQGFHYKILFF